MRNKIGFRTCGFSRWELPKAFAAIRREGYSGVELCLEAHGLLVDARPGNPALREALAAASDAGIEIASFSYHGDGEKLPRRWRLTEAAIEAAGASGVRILILNSPRIVPGQKERQLQETIARLKRYAARAERCEVQLALEPEPFLTIEGSEDMLRVIEAVGSEAVCVNLDLGHAWITDSDVPAYIRRLKRRIVHTHVEDIAGRIHKHLVPGTGDMPLRDQLAALADIRYAGYLTVDLFSIHDAPQRFARRALAGLKAAMP